MRSYINVRLYFVNLFFWLQLRVSSTVQYCRYECAQLHQSVVEQNSDKKVSNSTKIYKRKKDDEAYYSVLYNSCLWRLEKVPLSTEFTCRGHISKIPVKCLHHTLSKKSAANSNPYSKILQPLGHYNNE
jgi:hypothetical protein